MLPLYRQLRVLTAVVVCLVLSPIGVQAKTVNASSPAFADVSAAVTAAAEGDSVQIPAGSATWTQTLIVNKGILLKGSGINKTVITNGGVVALIDIALLQSVYGAVYTQPIEVSGISFLIGYGPVSNNRRGAIHIEGPNAFYPPKAQLTQVRIDWSSFDKGHTAIYWDGENYGVIDHNSFMNADIAVRLSWNNDWSKPVVPGTANSTFIEDNTFVVDSSGGAGYYSTCAGLNQQIYHDAWGARSTIRYNTFDTSLCHQSMDSPIEAHGDLPDSPRERGLVISELYNNTIHMYNAYRAMYFRAGSILAHDNAITVDTGSRPKAIELTNEYDWQTRWWNPLDTVWPSQDQIFNSFFWNNTINGTPVTSADIGLVSANDVPFIQENRDFWMHAPCDGSGTCVGGRTSWIDPSQPGAYHNEQWIQTGPNAYYGYKPYTHPHPLVVQLSAGSTYYVDVQNGNDGNAGSSQWPFKTIQKADLVVNPGDTVIVRDGVYTTANPYNLVELSRGGNAGGWVTYRSEHKWGAVLDGQSVTPYAFVVDSGVSYTRLQDFEMRNFASNAITVNPSDPSASHTYDISGNHIHDIGRICTDTPYGLDAIYLSNVSDVTVEKNVIHDIGRLANGENGCATTSNLVHDHGVYVEGTANLTAKNNLFYNITRGWAVHMYGHKGSPTNVAIVNNTFAFPNPNAYGQIIVSSPGANNLSIQDNIFYNPQAAAVKIQTTDGPTVFNNVSIDHNVTSNAPTSYGSAMGVTVMNNTEYTDPLLVSPAGGDFHLKPGSPAIGSGLSLPLVSDDLEGNPRPVNATQDLGAYKYVQVLAGDVSQDGQVTAYDAYMASQYAIGLRSLSPEQIKAADMSGNGQLTPCDAYMIAQEAVKLNPDASKCNNS